MGEKLLFYSKSPQEIDFVDCEQAENGFFSEKNKISMEKKREWLFETFLGLLLLFLDSNGCAYMLSMDEWIRMNNRKNWWSVVPPPRPPSLCKNGYQTTEQQGVVVGVVGGVGWEAIYWLFAYALSYE